MAEREDKTYPALPRRRQRAREQGNIARSPELTGAFAFAGAALAFAGLAPFIARQIAGAFRIALGAAFGTDLQFAIGHALPNPLHWIGGAVILLAIAAALGSAVQEGFVIALERLRPQLKRLSPATYFARVFSNATILEIGKASAKVIIVGLVAWSCARLSLERSVAQVGVPAAAAILGAGVRRLLGFCALIAISTATADYAYRRYSAERELKMTRQEFLDELKEEEGNPQIKRAIRRARRRMFKRARGIHQAAAATVVLTNPTHLAVALRYRRGFDHAPLVVAKGAGEAAARIITIARMAAVPVLENRPLARALFGAVDVGEFIPRQFYRAIAEVLAAVMRAQANAQALAGGVVQRVA